MICDEINALVRYGLEKGLIEAADEIWARNRILDILGLDGFEPAGEAAGESLEAILKAILDDAAAFGRRRALPRPVRGKRGSRHRLVLPLFLRHGLYPPLPHRKGPQVEGCDRVRRA